MRRRRAPLTFTLHSTARISFIGGNAYRLTFGQGWANASMPRVVGKLRENQLCLLTCGARWQRMDGLQKGKDGRVQPTASPSKNEGELDLHTKPRRVAVTDLSEESAFGAGRNASAVWPRPVTVKRLSSFRPEGQEQPGLAEAAGLLGRFRLTRLRGCWRGKTGHGLPKP